MFTQIAYASGPATRFERLSIEDGLSQASILSIVQDSKGFLWFATQDGLNRYDGYEFKVYRHNPAQPGSISHNFIRTLYVDEKGTLWIGTDGGLNRFNPQSDSFTHFIHDPSDPNSLSHDSVRTLYEDKQGGFWVGTNNGLNRFDTTTAQFTVFRHQPSNPGSLSNNAIKTIHEDNTGTLWVGTTGGGLNRFNRQTNRFIHFQADSDNPYSLSHNVVRTVNKDQLGNLWIGTRDGLNRYDSQSERFHPITPSTPEDKTLSSNGIRAIYSDSRGVLWVGTDNGLNQYDAQTQQFRHLHHDIADPHSLSHNTILSIYEDNRGILWVGTRVGLNQYNTNTQHFAHFKHQQNDPNSLAGNQVNAIHRDRQNKLWVGIWGGGLNQFDPVTQNFKQFSHNSSDPSSLSSNFVLSIHEDLPENNQGSLWIGTNGGGLNQYLRQSQEFVHFKHQPEDANSLSHNGVNVITTDNQGTLWVGTLGGGVNRFNTQSKSFERFKHQANNPNSLSNNVVMTLHQDTQGTLWIGTWGGGLNRFDIDNNRFEHLRHDPNNPHSLSNDIIFSCYEDSQGTLWIGTIGGLNQYDRQTGGFKHYREIDGLPNDTIYAISEDNSGQLWISTNRGLSRFNRDDKTFSNFDVTDGLQSNEFMANSVFRSNDGELFFGGINGFNRFFPEKIQDSHQSPPVVLTDFLLFNRSVPITTSLDKNKEVFRLNKTIDTLDRLTLSYHESLISFQFSALDFTNPIKNQYAYKLQGWDKDWIYTDAKNRRATYTNIPAGHYTLRIKASNQDGYWNEQGKSLQITMLPPPWKTWWAWLIYVFTATAMIFLFVGSQRQKILHERAVNLKLKRAQAEKMASLGTLTAGVAHEINNPTNFVHVSTQNLEVDLSRLKKLIFSLAGEDTDEAILQRLHQHFDPLYIHLSTIHGGTERITRIVQDLNAFTHLDISEQETINITTALQLAIERVQGKYPSINNITTDFHGAPSLTCYPGQLNQLFMHLIVNASHAIDDLSQANGQTAPAGEIVVACQLLGDMVEIIIKDNGCGMSEETISKIFEPFFTTKDVGKGTGLGLSIAYGFIQQHNGTVTVTSQPGQGAQFTLNLPQSGNS